jgi:hypothetical protein
MQIKIARHKNVALQLRITIRKLHLAADWSTCRRVDIAQPTQGRFVQFKDMKMVGMTGQPPSRRRCGDDRLSLANKMPVPASPTIRTCVEHPSSQTLFQCEANGDLEFETNFFDGDQ